MSCYGLQLEDARKTRQDLSTQQFLNSFIPSPGKLVCSGCSAYPYKSLY